MIGISYSPLPTFTYQHFEHHVACYADHDGCYTIGYGATEQEAASNAVEQLFLHMYQLEVPLSP